jgi:IclR family transcriptional regulator, acetate operon repressor
MDQPKRQRGRPRSQFKDSSAGTMQSLDRALGVLTALAGADGATLSDLARAVDIPTATTHRILITLQAHGFTAFNDERQEWSVGIEAYRTGAAFLKRSSVLEVGRPVMRRLMQETGETANIAVPDGSAVVFVGQVETQNPIRAFFAPGTRTSMHASGTGKAILAAMAPEALERVLAKMVLTDFTPKTLVTRDRLHGDLDATRARGWSFDGAERYEGMSCVGAAIYDRAGQPCAGISVSGPSVRFEAGRSDELGARVARAAAEITELSGGQARSG